MAIAIAIRQPEAELLGSCTGSEPHTLPHFGGYNRHLAPLCHGCRPLHLSPGRDSPVGSTSPHLQGFPGQHVVMQPEARSRSDLSPNLLDRPQVNPLPPGLLLVILRGLEAAKTRSSETNPERGWLFVLPCTSGCVEGRERRCWEKRAACSSACIREGQ